MEKLEKLLKEYAPNYCNDLPNGIIMDELVISKKFWFIKWLVENDKIDINEEWNDYEKTNLYCNSDFFQLQKHYSYYESLLMLLAIQDEPIEFLVSILK